MKYKADKFVTRYMNKFWTNFYKMFFLSLNQKNIFSANWTYKTYYIEA